MTKRALATLATFASVALASSVARAGTVETSESAGHAVRVFVPSAPAAKPAAVLMLHGCTQTAEAFAGATRMDAVAEENGFYVVYVEEPESVGTGRCFRWFDPKHQARGAGEPKEIADAVDAVVKAKGIDPERVYAAGLSAGAAMTVVLGATYPDRFAAIGVVAGLPYKAATSASEAFAVQSNGDVDANALGDAAKAAMGDVARVVPTLVIHGSSDGVVNVENGRKVAAQWVRTNGALLPGEPIGEPTTATGTAGGYATNTSTWRTASGAKVVELVVVSNLGHAWPGGLSGGSYADTRGPDASRALWSFFSARTKSAPLPVEEPGASTSSSSGSPGADADASSSGASPNAPESASSSDSGCAITRSSQSASLPSVAIAALVATLLRRRRTR